MGRMVRHFRILAGWVVFATVLLAANSSARADDVTVFAAASLRTALDEIGDAFERDTGHRLTRVYAGTPILARQIAQGAPADVFIAANIDWMDWLEAQGRVVSDTRRDLAGNQLVVIAHGADLSPWNELGAEAWVDILDGRPLAMALVDAVPAGLYGRAALGSLGLWDEVGGHVVQTDNVRAALALVALGEARLGIVYRSDARAEPRVSILGVFPEDSHPRIRYPAARVAGREHAASEALLDYLQSAAAREILRRQGFVVDDD